MLVQIILHCRFSHALNEIIQNTYRLFPIALPHQTPETHPHAFRHTFVSRALLLVLFGTICNDVPGLSMQAFILLFQILDEDFGETEKVLLFLACSFPFHLLLGGQVAVVVIVVVGRLARRRSRPQ